MTTNIKTTVSTEAIDLSELFPSDEDTNKTNIFSKESDAVDLEDEDEEEEETAPVEKTEEAADDTPITIESEEEQKEFEQAKGGKKADLIEFFKNKIEEGDLVPFSDFDDSKMTIDEYLKKFSKKDFDELWKANMDQKVAEIAEELPEQFKNSLPRELQYAAEYWQSGGTDMKGIFKALAQVEEIKALDPEKNPREVARQYLTATKFGSEEEINEQLDEWEDLDVITKKAQGFKPKLDKLEEEIVQQKIDQQNFLKEKQKEQFEFYVDNVVDAIKDSDLHGVDIDKKTQSSLYTGLTEYNFVDSRGNRCNEFSYLLDKKMWVEPDYKTIAMAQWLLKDREGFLEAVANKKVNNEVNNIVRTLKTEQSNTKRENGFESTPKQKRFVQRSSSMFKRS